MMDALLHDSKHRPFSREEREREGKRESKKVEIGRASCRERV